MNIFLSNNIVINVTQSPTDPLPGDTVVFQANQAIENTEDYGDNNNNYFYSYKWLVSRDGGATYTTAGPDLETLTLENISSSFFNEIYKLEVTLIDLDNMLLTEDGDVLTAEVGGVLLIDTNNLLSIQNTTNNNASSVSITNTNTTETAIDLVDTVATTNEAATFDPLIDAETADTVNSAQGIAIRNNVAQNISNDPIDVFLEDDPLPSVVLPNQIQNSQIQSGQQYAREAIESLVGCNTTLRYYECVPYDDVLHNGSPAMSLSACMGLAGPKACNFNSNDTSVTIDVLPKHKIGTIPTKKTRIRKNYTANTPVNDIQFEDGFVCCLNPTPICDGGLAACGNGDQWTNTGANGPECDINKFDDGPEVRTLVSVDSNGDSDLCGCRDAQVAYSPAEPDGSGGFVHASFGGAPTPDGFPAHLRPFDSPAPPSRMDPATGGWISQSTRAAEAGFRGNLRPPAPSQTGSLKLGTNVAQAAGWVLLVAMVAAGILGIIYYFRGRAVQAYLCAPRYLKKRIRCSNGPIIELSSLKVSATSAGGSGRQDFNDEEKDINKGSSPNYNCVCQRRGQTYAGSIAIQKNQDSCDWYVTSYTGKPGSSCTCSLTNSNSIEGDDLQPTYTYTIPDVPTSCDLPTYYTNACLFGVSAAEYTDCYFKGDQCGAECVGPLCCNSPRANIFELSNGGSSSKQCNQSISIFNPLSDDVMILGACPIPSATNTVTIQQASITERPRKCGEIANPAKNLFATYAEAKTAAQKQIQPGDVLIISKFKPIKDMSKTKELAPEIKRNDIVIAPALNSYYGIVFDGYEKIGNECELCQIWYSLSIGGGSYPCNDNGTYKCGPHTIPKQCNNPQSANTTRISIATIDKITSYNATDLELMKKNSNEYFTDCGSAISKGEEAVGKDPGQGFVCTNW